MRRFLLIGAGACLTLTGCASLHYRILTVHHDAAMVLKAPIPSCPPFRHYDKLEKDAVNPDLVADIWQCVTVITHPDDISMPEVRYLKRDYFTELASHDCERENGMLRKLCSAQRAEIRKQAVAELGENYVRSYDPWIARQLVFTRYDCASSADPHQRSACRTNRKNLTDGYYFALARTFLTPDRIEIYQRKIDDNNEEWDKIYKSMDVSNSYYEDVAFLYVTIAHEMIHVALGRRNVDILDQHAMMHDRHYLQAVSNAISDSLRIDRGGNHWERALSSLRAGEEVDATAKQTQQQIMNQK
ncbi:MAG: hypothetical protein KGI60_01310 [Patescibacteria group bacterium]|nr:hypothetical protein [Patescibacteria group bacterium]